MWEHEIFHWYVTLYEGSVNVAHLLLYILNIFVRTQCSKKEINMCLLSQHKWMSGLGCAVALAFTHWCLAVEVLIQSQDNPCGICDGQSGTGTTSSLTPWFSPDQCSILICYWGWPFKVAISVHWALPHSYKKKHTDVRAPEIQLKFTSHLTESIFLL